MKAVKIKNLRRWRRQNRVRKKLRGCSNVPRLSVFRSSRHLMCQLIDDESGKTLASASTQEKAFKAEVPYGGNCEAAKKIGEILGKRALAAGIERCRFDRGQFRFHGRVAEIANAAREVGLQF
ncbi:MAG: 50S ribosomal protein L18 [Pirellulaceae bacterium]|nr:50S ribosomal protein L18 [Pirellulaceae bacterium]